VSEQAYERGEDGLGEEIQTKIQVEGRHIKAMRGRDGYQTGVCWWLSIIPPKGQGTARLETREQQTGEGGGRGRERGGGGWESRPAGQPP